MRTNMKEFRSELELLDRMCDIAEDCNGDPMLTAMAFLKEGIIQIVDTDNVSYIAERTIEDQMLLCEHLRTNNMKEGTNMRTNMKEFRDEMMLLDKMCNISEECKSDPFLTAMAFLKEGIITYVDTDNVSYIAERTIEDQMLLCEHLRTNNMKEGR